VEQARFTVSKSSIHPSEIEDFENEIRRRGRAPDEFELTADDPELTTTQIQHVRGTVSVRNKKTGITRTYRYQRWVPDFIRDIDVSVF